MLKAKKQYHGRGAELAVKAEILVRGYNVADSEVEHGIDFHVYFPFPGPAAWRVEVKSSHPFFDMETGTWQAHFALSPSNVNDDTIPGLIFVFAPRFLDHWEFIVISRHDLFARLPPELTCPRRHHKLPLRFDFTPTHVLGPQGENYQPHRNHFDRYWPRRS